MKPQIFDIQPSELDPADSIHFEDWPWNDQTERKRLATEFVTRWQTMLPKAPLQATFEKHWDDGETEFFNQLAHVFVAAGYAVYDSDNYFEIYQADEPAVAKSPRYLTRQTPFIKIEPETLPDGDEMYSGVKPPGTGIHHEYGGPAWKLDVGAECNRLLELADAIAQYAPVDTIGLKTSDPETIRSIVERVANFEELETEQNTSR